MGSLRGVIRQKADSDEAIPSLSVNNGIATPPDQGRGARNDNEYGYPRVAVLIVTHNAKSYLPDLIQSLKNTDYPPDRVFFIFLDNASQDKTPEIIRQEFPQAHLVALPENTGFAKGNNLAAQYAQEFYPDYLVLLNQ